MDLGQTIRDLLLEQLEAGQDFGKQRSVLRMSETGHCLRQQYYRRTLPSTEDHVAAVQVWEMEDGHIHEEDVRSRLRRAGFSVCCEQEELVVITPEGNRVVGHIDGVIEGYVLPEPALLEVKAMSYIRFAKAAKFGIREANPDYYQQVQEYMHARGLGLTVFTIKAKDSSATKQQLRQRPDLNRKFEVEVIPYDEEAAMQALARQDQLAAFLQAGVPPQREYAGPGKDWHCDYCPFVGTCWAAS